MAEAQEAGGRQQAGSIEIEEDLPFQERAWMVQRVGWVAMGLAVLAAAVGLLGPGLLSRAEAGAPGDPMRVEYQRFLQFQTPTSLSVALEPTAARDGAYRLWLGRDYVAAVRIEAVTPPPERVEAGAERLIYVFPAGQIAGTTGVTFHFQPERAGPLSGQVGLLDGATLDIRHIVYP